MNKITNHIDTLASRIESLGMIKEAEELDVVSDTLEQRLK